MADQTLLQLFIELMDTYDSTIDTTAGSKFRSDVMDPLLNRVGDNPLDGDLETFLVERLQIEYPDMDVSNFSGIRDLVIRPMKTMLEPIRREINGVKLRQSILNADQMTKEELNILLENFFLSVRDGNLATGVVRIFFSTPQSIVVPSTASFFTDAGLEYIPVASSAISSSEMAFNFSNNEYFFDVDVEAIDVGSTYNIGSGQIIRVDGVLSATRVTNRLPITGGTAQETNQEAVTRAKSSITVKNLSTKRGVKTLLNETFPTIEDVKVVGFGEPEMLRDIVEGPVSVSNVPGGVPNTNVDVSANIHIGGKTDVYVKTPDNTLSANTIEVQNITDFGSIIQSSDTGEISSGGYGSNPLKQDLTDVNGFFRVVDADGTYFIKIDDKEFEIVGKGTGSEEDTRLILDVQSGLAASTPPRVEISYQIVRREFDGVLKIPLTNLAAEDSSGNIVLTSGTSSKVVPGSPTNAAFTDSSGNTVASTNNIAPDGNINLPLFSVGSASLINQTAGTRDDIPFSGKGYAKALDKFSGGTSSAKAEGEIRYYLPSKTHVMISDTEIEYDSLSEDLPYTIAQTSWSDSDGHKFVNSSSLSGSLNQVNVKWQTTGSFDYLFVRSTVVTSKGLEKGDWIIIADNSSEVTVRERVLLIEEVSTADFTAQAVTCKKVTVRFDGGSGVTAFTVSNTNVSSLDIRFVKGIHKDSLIQDPITNYYYVDLDVIADANGTSYNIDKATALTPTTPYVEGYKVLSSSRGESFSDRDVPVLHLTKYVNDLNLTLTSTSLDVDVSYDSGTDLISIQEFVDSEDNRIVSEDILVKHYKPVYVLLTISGKGLTASKGLEVLESFVDTLTDTIEVSDLISYLYDNGATRVDLPIEIVLERIDSFRESYNTFVVNSLKIDSNEKFYFSSSSSYSVTT